MCGSNEGKEVPRGSKEMRRLVPHGLRGDEPLQRGEAQSRGGSKRGACEQGAQSSGSKSKMAGASCAP